MTQGDLTLLSAACSVGGKLDLLSKLSVYLHVYLSVGGVPWSCVVLGMRGGVGDGARRGAVGGQARQGKADRRAGVALVAWHLLSLCVCVCVCVCV